MSHSLGSPGGSGEGGCRGIRGGGLERNQVVLVRIQCRWLRLKAGREGERMRVRVGVSARVRTSGLKTRKK